ncbi:MAG TPA: CHAD domain-containing protein, partial [Methanoregula sp.]|nr:CHAD domain-containing protein [Methanoregula sp.]
ITRALGEARDIDVQIAFLSEYRITGADEKVRGPAAADRSVLEPARAYLLDDLRQHRVRAQEGVILALDALEKSRIIREMEEEFMKKVSGRRDLPPSSVARGIPTMAAFRISSRLAAMRSYESWIFPADAVAEHHAMRIAAKKLRYTMEIYGPVYRNELKKPHAAVKNLQQILGDLHDCDVWIDRITRLLLYERGRLRSLKEGPDTETLASLREFLKDRQQERETIHVHLVRYWQDLDKEKIWDLVSDTLVNGQKREYRCKQVPDPAALRAASAELASSWPAGIYHQANVARLSLMLFDGLIHLHHLSNEHRALLECAALLHDIGMTGGKKKHPERSALRIFSAESLPLDMAGRSVAGLIASSHHGEVRIRSHPLFPLLSGADQDAVVRLAALHRIGNALDHSHSGAVREVHCLIGKKEILCNVIATGDVSREIARAVSQAGLFREAFQRELVFR